MIEENAEVDRIISHLEKLVAAMRSLRVTHLEMPVAGQDKALVVDLSPDAWRVTHAPIESVGEALGKLPINLCPCGHDIDTEHSEVGCLHGCADSLCNAEEPKE